VRKEDNYTLESGANHAGENPHWRPNFLITVSWEERGRGYGQGKEGGVRGTGGSRKKQWERQAGEGEFNRSGRRSMTQI